MEINYYEILECEKNSTPVEIKKQYRKLAMRWHPDKNVDKEEVLLTILFPLFFLIVALL